MKPIVLHVFTLELLLKIADQITKLEYFRQHLPCVNMLSDMEIIMRRDVTNVKIGA